MIGLRMSPFPGKKYLNNLTAQRSHNARKLKREDQDATCSILSAPAGGETPHEDLQGVLGAVPTLHSHRLGLVQHLLLLVDPLAFLDQPVDVLVYLLQQLLPVHFLFLLLLLLIITESC